MKGNPITKSDVLIFIEIIYDKSLSFNKIYIKDDLYEFIYQVSLINENIDEEQILNACIHNLNYKKNKEEAQKNEEEDMFEAHNDLFRGENYLKKKSEQIIYLIDLYNKKNNINKEENLKKLLNICLDEEFIEIKLHLLKLLGKNIEC